MDTPLVSIWTLAYLHAPFIRQCLEGILMQKTTFSFELIIHDDASTDETADIIREYETRYPDVIKAIYQSENQFTKGGGVISKFVLPKTQGKYIAMCEGDDYWTDPLKLQKQVDFLETHPDYSMCAGRFWLLDHGETDLTEPDWMTPMAKYPKGRTVILDNYMNPYLLQFLTVCFRTDCFKTERFFQLQHAKDDTFYALLLEQGKGFVFPDYFGVYRRHQGGIWAGKKYQQQLDSNKNFFPELFQHFGDKSKSVRRNYFKYCINLRFVELKTSKHLCRDYLKLVQFVFSGKVKEIFLYKIPHLLYLSKTGFIYFFKKRFVKNQK